MVKRGICIVCRREMRMHSKNMCVTCWKKKFFKGKIIVCKRCKRSIKHHAKGYCAGCYNTVFHLDRAKACNYKRNFGLGLEEYRSLTQKCLICGFSHVVDLHHLDHNRKNNSKENLIPLCPNHHQMLHKLEFAEKIKDLLKRILQAKKEQTTLDPIITITLSK